MKAEYTIENLIRAKKPYFVFVDNYESLNEVVNWYVSDIFLLNKVNAVGVWNIKYKTL